jgi:hypothetical protein
MDNILKKNVCPFELSMPRVAKLSSKPVGIHSLEHMIFDFVFCCKSDDITTLIVERIQMDVSRPKLGLFLLGLGPT